MKDASGMLNAFCFGQHGGSSTRPDMALQRWPRLSLVEDFLTRRGLLQPVLHGVHLCSFRQNAGAALARLLSSPKKQALQPSPWKPPWQLSMHGLPCL